MNLERIRATFRTNPGLGYGLAVASCLAALAVRHFFDSVFPPGFPYVSFFPAVIVTAYLAGLGPGILSIGLCAAAARYFFMLPERSLGLNSPTALAIGFFLCVASFMVALIVYMQRVTDRLRAEQGRTRQLYEQHRVMFQELQHRVANNMQFVASLLHMQKRKVMIDPSSITGALDEASQRIEMMARIHRRLYDPSIVDQPIEQFFREIGRDLIEAAGAEHVAYIVNMPPIRLDIERLMLLSLLATEVITNCLKHAFEDRTTATIELTLAHLDPAELELTIRDDGRGLPPDYDPKETNGLGTRILQGLAAQLGGKLTLTSGSGTTTRVRFPA